MANRKSIFPFIHNLTEFLIKYTTGASGDSLPGLLQAKLSGDFSELWEFLQRELNESKRNDNVTWGEMEGVHKPADAEPPKNDYIVRRHSQDKGEGTSANLTDTGRASTTKEIVKRSVNAFKGMALLDPEINK